MFPCNSLHSHISEFDVIIRRPILKEEDAILSGVDFHCSRIIEELLQNSSVVEKIKIAISRYNLEQGENVHITSFEDIVKKSMWKYCGFVNFRKFRLSCRKISEYDGMCCSIGNCVIENVSGGSLNSHSLDYMVWSSISSDVQNWSKKYITTKLLKYN